MSESVEKRRSELSEPLVNLIKNLACGIAEMKGGKVSLCDLIPYLPLSWSLIDDSLSEMVDGESITTNSDDGIKFYNFTVLPNKAAVPGKVVSNVCLGCDRDLEGKTSSPICGDCLKLIANETSR